jgi:hypothetical protein
MVESMTSPYKQAAKFIVAKLEDNDDQTLISKKILEKVLKPLLKDYIGEAIRSEYKLKEDWFTQDYNAEELTNELEEYFEMIEFSASKSF